jgi:D-serine deaminase-like pyridoxal phosphate-dependent protein
VVDRHVFSKNCARMHANAAGYGAAFRAHLKTHEVINRSGGSMSTIQCPVFISFTR